MVTLVHLEYDTRHLKRCVQYIQYLWDIKSDMVIVFVCQNYITNSIFCLCIRTPRNKRKYSKREKETMVNEGDTLKYFAALEKSKYACRLISRFWSLVFQGGHVWWRIVDGILINKHLNCWCHLSCTILYAHLLND